MPKLSDFARNPDVIEESIGLYSKFNQGIKFRYRKLFTVHRKFNTITLTTNIRGERMGKSRFLEGLIMGVILGVIGLLFFDEQSRSSVESSSNEEQGDQQKSPQENAQTTKKKAEASVAKTLEAIEKGFEKITKIIDERKVKEKNT